MCVQPKRVETVRTLRGRGSFCEVPESVGVGTRGGGPAWLEETGDGRRVGGRGARRVRTRAVTTRVQ